MARYGKLKLDFVIFSNTEAVLTPYLSDRILGLRGLEIGTLEATAPCSRRLVTQMEGQLG